MAQVRLDRLTQQFGATPAIQDITFTVPDGEFWVLVGPSGCGKSTILRAIAGLSPITAGTVHIGDRVVNTVPARDRDVAMVFQNYALYPHMTVAQNLAFGLKMRGAQPAHLQQRVTIVAQALGLTHLLDRKPRQLSGGQQQRVALGRAIARQPQVFLMDEPLSNLDAQLRDETRTELKRLHQQFGITTLYVTHDQVEAMTLADRVVVLSQGHRQQIGTPAELYAQPANQMVATFIGNPPMNLLPVTVQAQTLQLGSTPLPVSPAALPAIAAVAPTRLNLGIRPEHIQILPATDPAATLTAVVAVVEPLGREVLLRATLTLDNVAIALNLLTTPDLTPRVGDRLGLHFNPEQIFLFAAETGQRLYPAPLSVDG